MGKHGGIQTLKLSQRCALREKTVFHEFMHAIGVHHYQQRPDRDEYISYHEDIYDLDHNHEMAIYSSTYKTNYDEKSFMHYRPYRLWNGEMEFTSKV